MSYQNHAIFDNAPPLLGYENEPFYDRGSGIPQMNANNLTINDMFKSGFLLTSANRHDFKNMAPVALQGIQSNSELSALFFSDENIKRLQRQIKAEVFRRTKGVFRLDVDQEQREMFIAMRAVYLEQARFIPGEIVRQVKRLNLKVISEITPGIISGIKQEYGYLKEINKPLSPIARPINANNRGRKVLPSVCTTFGS